MFDFSAAQGWFRYFEAKDKKDKQDAKKEKQNDKD